jgi:hypothetical protein
MSNDSSFVSESLEALLVSIAGGMREAQDALNAVPPVDAYGRPLPTYHLPYLDFELKVDMETVKREGGGFFLKVKSLGKGDSSSTQSVSSTLSGRLVAVPPGEGLPIPVLTITSVKETARRHKIIVTASNSAGEILPSQGVELNINLEASQLLSSEQGVNLASTRAGTKLDDVILLTDENGMADTLLHIDSGLAARAQLVITAELGTESVNLVVQAGGG